MVECLRSHTADHLIHMQTDLLVRDRLLVYQVMYMHKLTILH